jgi:uncharacterized protein (DUF1800 family)
MSDSAAFIAATRFGMGAGQGELASIGREPRGWLEAQLAPAALPPQLALLPPTPELAQRFAELRAERKAEKQADPAAQADEKTKGEIRALYLADAAARTRQAITTPTPLTERLVQFWSNHFTVSTARPVVAPLAGAFEREAIRPNVTGHFYDLLRAVVRHPAMLLYLDNAVSLGPDSVAGQRRQKGLNENLARELLELHTLGVDGGYGQGDVEQLARILTGWTIGNERQGAVGAFLYQPRFHQPGAKRLLGVDFTEAGQAEGERALLMLARHPATAHFVATKLVRHFVADDPPAAAVEAVARSFRDSDGDLAVVTKTVINRPEAWAEPLAKIKTPNDFVVSTLRAVDVPPIEDKKLVRSLALLGQAPFTAPSPAGWPDRAEAWMGPEALMRRLEWARDVASKLPRTDVLVLAEQSLGPLLDASTRQAIGGAADSAEALVLLLASRPFQRR